MAADLTATLRRATPDDVDAWVAVMAAVAAERRWIGSEPPVDTPERRERFVAMATAPTVTSLLVEEDGRVVGTGGLVPGSAPGVAGIGMALLAEVRGRGLGGLLLDGLLDAARSGTWHKVELQVWPHNGRAIGLYVSRGFVVEGLLKAHYRRQDGALWDALVMGLPLGEGR